jgi:hypothetical protein
MFSPSSSTSLRVSNSVLPCLLADVFCFGDWNTSEAGFSQTDPEIQSLSAELHGLATKSRAASTFQSYSGPWAKFKSWCQEKQVPCLPASPLTVALYLTKLLRTADSPSPVLTCSGAIYLHHQLAGLPSPTQHPLVSMSREIAKRIKLSGQNVKKPFLASHIRRLFEFWRYSPSANLFDLMRLSAVTLCFAGFLRFSDLMTVQWHEIRFFPSHMELFLEKSKTDQYRDGRWVLIARVSGRFCPVTLVEHLLRVGRYAAHGPGGLIRNTTISPSKQTLRQKQPSYTTVLQWSKSAAVALGLDPCEYGTHSGRRGGATGAANVDVPDRLFKEHGAWKSERVKDGYVVDSLQARLSVTANLGLQPGVTLDELVQFEREARLAP